MKRACLILCIALGCGGHARDDLADARGALADADYAGAIEAADRGLARSAEAPVAWGLELVRLEALARAGRAEDAVAQLERLGSRHPERIPATQYSATADQLRLAGEGAAAIQVLDMGLARHPGNATIEQLIGAASTGQVDPAELEMLRSLGYID